MMSSAHISMKTITFTIVGMHCASCAVRNEESLKKVNGVANASVNFGTHSATVEFDESLATEQALFGAIIKNGYKVLTQELAKDHKKEIQSELRAAQRRAFLALLFVLPALILAMLEIEFPWSVVGINVSVWMQAALSTI